MTSRMKVLLTFTRSYKRPMKSWNNGVKYEAVTYYPRKPDHVDPPFAPSKVLMVIRVKPFKGNPYWDKDILKKLGFEEKGGGPVIVKNTPEMCAQLWKVKHLVKIIPVKLPEKLPDPNDLSGCYLHHDGRFCVVPKVDPVRYELAEKEQYSIKRLTKESISEKLRLQWLIGIM